MLGFFGLSSAASTEEVAPSAADAAAFFPSVEKPLDEGAAASTEEVGVQPDVSKATAADPSKGFDSGARYTGTVNFFSKLKGYGFIDMATKGLVPKDVVFVHWQSLETGDRYAFLKKGMEVEFGIQELQGVRCKLEHTEGSTEQGGPSGGLTHRAKGVTKLGGKAITVQDQLDSELKTFVGGSKDLRYSGTLKFYDPKKGYGYITIDAGYDFANEVGLDGAQLRVERAEVNAGGSQPLWMSTQAVEFGIWATTKGTYKAYNMTLPDGIPLTQAALENRVAQGGEEKYHGSVKVWNWKQGWGFVKLAEGVELPAAVKAKLQEQALQAQEKAVSKGKSGEAQEELLYFRKTDIVRGSKIDRGSKVTFQIYTDDKGAGAQEVQAME